MTDRSITGALRESAANLRDYDRWAMLAWIDTSLRYRRTVLGPWWLTLSAGAMIGSVGLLWGAIFNMDLAVYMPFFTTGMVIWTLISGALIQGCEVFTLAGPLIKAVPTPLIVHVNRMMTRQLIIFAHNALLIVLVWIIFRWPLDWSVLLALPGLIIVTIALTGSTLFLGVLCTRFRDIPQMVTAILQLLFLLTPVMWTPDSVRGKIESPLLELNPFYYLLEVVRGPLLHKPPDLFIWVVAAGLALAAFLLGQAFYGRFRHRIAYWL